MLGNICHRDYGNISIAVNIYYICNSLPIRPCMYYFYSSFLDSMSRTNIDCCSKPWIYQRLGSNSEEICKFSTPRYIIT